MVNQRPELSKHNKYWISKHRYYELKHFCMQYSEWKAELTNITYIPRASDIRVDKQVESPVETIVERTEQLTGRIRLIENVAYSTDAFLARYILKAVTENVSYTYLKNVCNIPCGRDYFYERYRRFFWTLSKAH